MKTNTFQVSIGGMIMVFFLLSFQAHAQYNTAIGLRIGGTSGVDGKYFYKPSKAVEGIIGSFGNGFSLTALIEKYTPFENATGLYFYYGGGAHLAFYNGKSADYGYFGREVRYYRNNDVGLGINGIVGIEYRLPENIPLSFSIDLKPFIELGTGGYLLFAPDPSLGIKFIIR